MKRSDRCDDANDKLHQGRGTSKFFGGLSFFLLVSSVLSLLGGYWAGAACSLGFSIVTSWISYRLAGGRENPGLFANKDLFGIIRYAVRSADVRIGFHRSSNQDSIVAKLHDAGISLSLKGNRRDHLRTVLIENSQVFEACRELMFIECTRDGRECFWDGLCRPKTSDWFNDAEIIISFESRAVVLVDRFFELVDDAGRTA